MFALKTSFFSLANTPPSTSFKHSLSVLALFLMHRWGPARVLTCFFIIKDKKQQKSQCFLFLFFFSSKSLSFPKWQKGAAAAAAAVNHRCLIKKTKCY